MEKTDTVFATYTMQTYGNSVGIRECSIEKECRKNRNHPISIHEKKTTRKRVETFQKEGFCILKEKICTANFICKILFLCYLYFQLYKNCLKSKIMFAGFEKMTTFAFHFHGEMFVSFGRGMDRFLNVFNQET